MREQIGGVRKSRLTIVAYWLHCAMPTIIKSDAFAEWLDKLRDRAGGVCQRSCPVQCFSSCVFGHPGHGAAAACFLGERVGGPMAFALCLGPDRVEPDRAYGAPVACVS